MRRARAARPMVHRRALVAVVAAIVGATVASRWTLVGAQIMGTGTYKGYRQRQTCDPAGGRGDNKRLKATLDFALCCHRRGEGVPCCENCISQFSEYFDFIFPCWNAQGGAVLQLKVEEVMDINDFQWDSDFYRWKCAGSRSSLPGRLALALMAVAAAMLALHAM